MTNTASSAGSKITLQLYGNSLQQLFENVAVDLLKTIINPEEVGETLREKIVLEGPDSSTLLHQWVDMLVGLAHNQKILYKHSRFQQFDLEQKGPGKLRAEITGELLDPQRHTFKIDPIHLRCETVNLLNNSKTIEAQIILVSTK